MRAFLLAILCLLIAGPAYAAPPAADFGKLQSIYDSALSPDGERIALFQLIQGRYGVRVIRLADPTGKPVVVMLGEGVKPRWVKWANDERVLFSIWQSAKIQRTPVTAGYLYSMDAEMAKIKLLIKPDGIFRQYNSHVVDFLSDDPNHILMKFSDENVLEPDVQKVNVETGRYRKVQRGRKNIQDWLTDRNGNVRIGQGIRDGTSEEKWQLIIKDMDQDKWNSYEDYPGLKPDENVYGFTANPDELVVGRYAGKDTRGLYIYDLAEKKITRKLFHHDTYDARGLVLTGDGKDVAGASYVADAREVELFDEYESALEALRAKLPAQNIDYIDQSADGKYMLILSALA